MRKKTVILTLRAIDCLARRVVVSMTLMALFVAPVLSLDASQDKKNQESKSEDETVRLRSDLVLVSATITDANGQYAHGLSAKDFAILEDDAPQTLDSFHAEEAPFAAAILIDMSGSMGYKFGLARGAAAAFAESIRDNDQVAVFGFNDKVQQFQDFTNVRDISDYIWDAEAKDQTRLYDCMDEALAALEKREEKRRAIVLISDGWDTRSSRATLDSVMKRALRAGVMVYTVDLIEDKEMTGSTNVALYLRRGRAEMKELADKTGGRYIHSPQGDKLDKEFINVVDELRNQYTLAYYTSNQKRDGRWRKITVNTSKPGLSVRARRGYHAPKQ
jgi:Ca-activated chloride channel family protein